jgi:hypothetical protein
LLQRLSAKLSIRQTSASTKISIGSIQNVLKLAEQQSLSWPLPDELDDQALALKFYPRSDAKPSAKYQTGMDRSSSGVEEKRSNQTIALGRLV